MNPIAAALLWIGVASELAAMVGVGLAADRLDRLHFSGATNTLGPLLLAAAVLVDVGLDPTAVRVCLIAIVLMGTGPVVTHALGRAIGLRDGRVARRLEPRDGS